MAKRPSLHKKDNSKRPPSLYRKDTNGRSPSYRRSTGNRRNGQWKSDLAKALAGIFIWIRNHPRPARNIFIIVIVFLMIFLVAGNIFNGNDDVGQTSAAAVLIGNDSVGSVYKEGPYGNNDSDVKIAYILGVHPRESGAHQLMEKAFKEKADSLNCSYYLYKINVTSDSSDYDQSRLNGQMLAKKYAVPDMIDDNFTAAIDAHYSNGYWGVSRFVFTPNESNVLSSQLGNAIADNFSWIEYYVPPDPTSPEYVTGPLNDGGVAAIIYEAYTDDADNVTLDHDRQIVDFVDGWAITKLSQPKEKGFFNLF